jgi:hypothetical protein
MARVVELTFIYTMMVVHSTVSKELNLGNTWEWREISSNNTFLGLVRSAVTIGVDFRVESLGQQVLCLGRNMALVTDD